MKAHAMSDVVRIKRLRRLYDKDENVAKTFDWIDWTGHDGNGEHPSNDLYDGRVTEVAELDSAKTGTDLAHRDVIAVLKTLEEIEIGKFLAGRHGKKSRFEWGYTPISVARCARNQGDELVRVDKISDAAARDEIDHLSSVTGSARLAALQPPALKVHRFWLRDDFEVSVSLPMNLTQDEKSDLATFIQAIRTV